VGAVEDPASLRRYALSDPAPAVRSVAAEALLAASSPDPGAVRALLASDDPVVAGQAATWLEEHPDPVARDGLEALVRRAADPALVPDDVLAAALGAWAALGIPAGGEFAEAARRAASGRGLLVQRAYREALPQGGEPGPAPRPGVVAAIRGRLPPAREARVVTDRGEFVIELLPEVAPLAVARFAEIAEADGYDGLPFHRVVPDFVVQGGDPRGDGWGGTGRALPDELSWLPFEAGTVGLASAGPDTADSQWFVTLSPQPHLTGVYTLFGRVVLGRDVLLRIQRGDVIRDIVVERAER
jgi:cyclophilin family peptidyl-prolyl cis-trans isomerase